MEIQSLMVSDAFNSLTHRILTLPKGTAEIHFFPPAHSCHYPPPPAVTSSTLTAGFLFVHSCTHVFKKNDDFKKNDSAERMPTHSSQKSFFSLFFGEKLFGNFHREISGENDCSSVRKIAFHENDLCLTCARERCHVTSQGGT
jgi:hypothetical protein